MISLISGFDMIYSRIFFRITSFVLYLNTFHCFRRKLLMIITNYATRSLSMCFTEFINAWLSCSNFVPSLVIEHLYKCICMCMALKWLTSSHVITATHVLAHYSDVIMDTMASLITSLTSVYSTVHPGADQRKHQSSALLAFVGGIHRRPVNSPHNWPVTRKMFPFDDVIMIWIMKNKFTWRRYYIHPQGTDVHLYYLRTLLPEVHEGIYTLDKLYHHTYMVWM